MKAEIALTLLLLLACIFAARIRIKAKQDQPNNCPQCQPNPNPKGWKTPEGTVVDSFSWFFTPGDGFYYYATSFVINEVSQTFAAKFDSNFAMVWKSHIADVDGESNFYIYDAAPTPDGDMLVTSYSTKLNAFVLYKASENQGPVYNYIVLKSFPSWKILVGDATRYAVLGQNGLIDFIDASAKPWQMVSQEANVPKNSEAVTYHDMILTKSGKIMAIGGVELVYDNEYFDNESEEEDKDKIKVTYSFLNSCTYEGCDPAMLLYIDDKAERYFASRIVELGPDTYGILGIDGVEYEGGHLVSWKVHVKDNKLEILGLRHYYKYGLHPFSVLKAGDGYLLMEQNYTQILVIDTNTGEIVSAYTLPQGDLLDYIASPYEGMIYYSGAYDGENKYSFFKELGCMVGYGYSATSGRCDRCPAGTSKDKLGNMPCKPCQEGEYQKLEGKAFCDKCPNGNCQASEEQKPCVCQCPATCSTSSYNPQLPSKSGHLPRKSKEKVKPVTGKHPF